jgi:hypothetical protein
MKSKRVINRRDLCYTVGSRAQKLTGPQMRFAWRFLAIGLAGITDPDSHLRTPKFRDIIELIRAATIRAKKKENQFQ